MLHRGRELLINVFKDDPCDHHERYLDSEGLLSAGKETGPDPVCHRPLDEKWYRIISPAGEDIPQGCVKSDHCNTEMPIWRNGRCY